jgi:diguanylate cyclase (GGDEF)-like protein
MPEGQLGRDSYASRTAQTVSPVRSLPARISFIVFGATLITSLAVTAISVRSIDDFLRGRIEQSFPTLLEGASRRLDLWYDQRLLELGVFANSGILAENAPFLSSDLSTQRARRARLEIEQYLSYVLESVPQYEALFVLGPNGERLLWAGAPVELPDAMIRGDLSGVTETRVSGAVRVDGHRVQVASAPLSRPGVTPTGTIHAVMGLDAVAEVLAADEMGEFGEIFLLDADRNYLVARPERLAQQTWRAPGLDDRASPRVTDYNDYRGRRVVGAARVLDRFGWIVAVEEPYEHAFEPVVSGMKRVLGTNLAIVLLFALAAYRVARSIAKPIEALSDIARRISRGEKGIETLSSDRRDEVGILTRTFNEMTWRLENNARELERSQAETQAAVERMREQNTELQRVNEILEQLSITDGLTQLHNHRYFQEYLNKEVKRASRTSDPLSLVLIDIDHFKLWNDRLGHSGGDDILRRIAGIMQRLTRGTDLLARYGGEEFALLLPATDVTGAVQLAEKIRSTISESEFFLAPEGERQPLTVSIGVSVFAGDKRRFFDEADAALYRAKHAGRDCVMVAGNGVETEAGDDGSDG